MKVEIIDLENIATKDVTDGHQNGLFIPVWRDWDKIYANEPKMVYVTTCYPGEVKGPHLHHQRWSYLTVLQGKVVFVVQVEGRYEEYIIRSDTPQTIVIPAGTPQAHVNISDCDAIVINLCNPAWHPDRQDNFTADYGDYDFSKWGARLTSNPVA